MPINLSSAHLKIVSDILEHHLQPYEVRLFGSRNTDDFKPFSDLDLAIMTETPLPDSVLANVREAFSESDLPYRVDILDWSMIEPSFRARIQNSSSVLKSAHPPL